MTAAAPSRLRVVAPVGFAQLVGYGGTYYLPAILAAPIGRDLGLAPSWTFAGLSAALVVSSFIGPAVGRFVDNGGARQALVAANIAFAAGLALLGSAHGPLAPQPMTRWAGSGWRMSRIEARPPTAAAPAVASTSPSASSLGLPLC